MSELRTVPTDNSSSAPKPKEDSKKSEWLERVKKEVLLVNRHGKINPRDTGFTDDVPIRGPNWTAQLPQYFMFPRADLRAILQTLNFGGMDQVAYQFYPLICASDFESGHLQRKFIVIQLEGFAEGGRVGDDRGAIPLRFMLAFPPAVGRELLKAIQSQEVPASILCDLYDYYYPPNKRQLYENFRQPKEQINLLSAEKIIGGAGSPNARAINPQKSAIPFR